MQHHNWGMGMRTLKTALAIWLAFGVCDLLQFSNGTLAAITTIVAVQPSLKGSMTTIKNQLIATTFGCGLAVVVAYYFHGSYTAIAISAILAIVLCVRLNLKDSIVLLLVTIILIGQTSAGKFPDCHHTTYQHDFDWAGNRLWLKFYHSASAPASFAGKS